MNTRNIQCKNYVPLRLYTIFHLNLAFSSIEEELRAEVIRRCYWPLLGLARNKNVCFGIEASAFTLESIQSLDSQWIEEFRALVQFGKCELIGSGYTQLIGPLVPAAVNCANLRLGMESYQKLLGLRPKIALVNEQAYSAGLVGLYRQAGFQAIVMEWDNPARNHPEWNPGWRYLPQYAISPTNETIALIWNKSIAFQQFQRYVHDQIELKEYLSYLTKHLGNTPRAFPLYGNDVEIFDFRPGRFSAEPAISESEWGKIEQLIDVLLQDGRFQFELPSEILPLLQEEGAGNRLRLETAAQPVPVKKQEKYNITRWAVTGRNDIGINTACWQIYKALHNNPFVKDDDWRELCYLWSSDFRTHITQKRWEAYNARLQQVQSALGLDLYVPAEPEKENTASGNSAQGIWKVEKRGRYIIAESENFYVSWNQRRGLALDCLRWGSSLECPQIGTIPHGYFDDISWGADYYTGHLIWEIPSKPKGTDLEPVEPAITIDNELLIVTSTLNTSLGDIKKRWTLNCSTKKVEYQVVLDWKELPSGSLRLGHVTVLPEAFQQNELWFRTCNGGCEKEIFFLEEAKINHAQPATFLVSASQGLGLTNGDLELGDQKNGVKIEVDKERLAAIALVTYQKLTKYYFFRIAFSIREMDETCRPDSFLGAVKRPFEFRMLLSPLS